MQQSTFLLTKLYLINFIVIILKCEFNCHIYKKETHDIEVKLYTI